METTSSCSVDLCSTENPKADPEDQDLSSIDRSDEKEDSDNEGEDSDNNEEDDEFEEEGSDSDSESEEDEEYSSEEEEPKCGWEWDKDSYDGYQYYSDSASDFSDEEEELNWRRYNRQCIDSKGFYVDPEDIPSVMFGGIFHPFIHDLGDYRSGEGLTKRENCIGWANLCLEKFNEEHGSNVKLEDVLWVNRRRSSYRFGGWPKFQSDVYCITFVAKEFESPDAPLLEYQAKMETHYGEIYLIFCRPSLNPTWMREKLNSRKSMRELANSNVKRTSPSPYTRPDGISFFRERNRLAS